ncbi:putative toxin-antitoxin system toxin component, PIN family [Runella rosea]|uniref:Putative toxin-antitoxin system toxin component, PIN family n=1 Tax=Runella rosea TaxID=2259595 RepID=A0A344TQU5_9BACT|nr:putative toxin-antitoxin system toxin component, PIN family [Runella rosea]AXE21016.1 putative toxin-antitoxin system toxin component, PIN family [Runella rosea]
MPKKIKIRVILDTNLWISFLISKRLKVINNLFNREAITLIFSQELLDEFIEVAQRPKFKKYFSITDLERLLTLFDTYGELVTVISTVDICRDEKDNFLLALAKDSRANYLITGDEDLLIIKKFEDTEIVSYTQFEVYANEWS